MLEYNPAPPFDSGTPEKVGAVLMEEVMSQRREIQEKRRQLIREMLERRAKK
jgi:hypothetical protein